MMKIEKERVHRLLKRESLGSLAKPVRKENLNSNLFHKTDRYQMVVASLFSMLKEAAGVLAAGSGCWMGAEATR